MPCNVELMTGHTQGLASAEPLCRLVCFHGPVKEAAPFFRTLGFECPVRKDVANFLQEVTTPKGGLQKLNPFYKDAEPTGHCQMRVALRLQSPQLQRNEWLVTGCAMPPNAACIPCSVH